MSTRALFRPARERSTISDTSLSIMAEIDERQAALRSTHVSDYDACAYRDDYDPVFDVLTPTARGADNWGASMPSPSQAPQNAGFSWYKRK